ncbi:leucine-rich repeat-containing protein 15-like [Littorina saxatilis]|uniref:Uncharacterized protein n=1 Tax=Littorina saxatilis TaxID=31220 RepID=A0AAN9BTI6_9CAEN
MSMFVLLVSLTSSTQLCWSQPLRTCWLDPHTVRRPCFKNKCYCSKLTADCSSNAGNLSFIPKLTDSVIFLNFSNNSLAKIDGVDFFANVSTRLHFLDLYNNGLTYIAPGSFRRFTKLTKLLIGGNKLNYSTLPLGAVVNVPTLEALDIACGGLGPVPSVFFYQHAMPLLARLELSYNDIRHLDMNVFQPLQSLHGLLLWNKLGELTPSYLPSLSHLGLHENALVDFPDT